MSLLWSTIPKRVKHPTMALAVWEASKGGKYRIYRIASRHRKSVEFSPRYFEGGKWLPLAPACATLEEALIQASHHASQAAGKTVVDNSLKVLEKAHELHLADGSSHVPQRPNSTREGYDTFGCRLGSKKARLNALLAHEPQDMATLVNKAGLESGKTYYNHLNGLAELGLIVKTPQGYALTQS